jgi:His-Xaa-Ser system protein HxsD
MDFLNGIKDDEIFVFVDISIYSKDSIFKCLYWYSDKFHVNVSHASENILRISVKQISTELLSMQEKEDILIKLERDLIDYNLRDIVTKETKNIRDLLVAKAFSNGEFDELPPGEISDPVGFNINEI